MPDIAPFKAYYYNAKNQAELETLIAPPHDVISPAEKNTFLHKNSENIVQIILPDSYHKAAETIKYWIDKKTLIQTKAPAFYIYRTKYSYNGHEKIRYGLVTLVKLSDFSEKQIIPHERTFKKETEGRFNLLQTTHANFNPIFFIFNGNPTYFQVIKRFISQPPFQVVTDSDGVEHTIWVIENIQTIQKLQQYFQNIPLIIADGHHRYTSALAYAKKHGNNYILGLLVDINDSGLQVFPTHRLIRYVENQTQDDILSRLQEYFDIQSYKFELSSRKNIVNKILNELEVQKPISFGMVLYNLSDLFLIKLKEEYHPEDLVSGKYSDSWKRLNVSLLHDFVFKELLNIPQKYADSENINYIKKCDVAISAVQEGLYQLSFILAPPKVEQILEIAANSEIMPHKSTYFYPKPLSGLLIHKWD
ncbi:MAG: DUF1015 domain-containing protein [Candidatus Helarchaeota archaeon]